MRRTGFALGAFAAAISIAAPSAAQFGGSMPSGLSGLAGSGSSLLGGGLPNIGGSSVGNAAGVLSYCVQNNVLSGSNASSALGSLMAKPGVTSSPGFASGQSGQVVTGQGQSLSLDDMKGRVKSKVCDLVLQHAKSFIGGSAAKIGR